MKRSYRYTNGLRLFCWSAVVCLLAIPINAGAQEGAAGRERAGVMVGAFLTHRDSGTRLDPAFGTGTDIDFEGDLGLKKSLTVGRFGGYLWLKPRHRFDLSYFDLSRTATRRIDQTLVFGDQTFVIDTVVTTEADATIVKADYTFVPLNRERGYLGVTAGLYVASTRTSLSEPTLGTANAESLTAPLPVIGLRGEYNITNRITLRGVGQVFDLEVDNVGGHLRDYYVGADYAFTKRFAVGLAYNKVTMTITADEPDGFRGELDWGYDGVMFYFKADFGELR